MKSFYPKEDVIGDGSLVDSPGGRPGHRNAASISGARSVAAIRMPRSPTPRGWAKSATEQGETRLRALARGRFAFTFPVAAYKLKRLLRLLETG